MQQMGCCNITGGGQLIVMVDVLLKQYKDLVGITVYSVRLLGNCQAARMTTTSLTLEVTAAIWLGR